MSGIEVAGVVLGAIPLLIAAFQQYAEGVSTVQRLLKYEHPLTTAARNLKTEYEISRNTCEQLLDGLVPDSKMSELLNQPSGAAWENLELKQKIKSRLRTSFDGYMQTMNDMDAALNDIKILLKLDSSGKPRFTGTSRFLQQYQRFRFSLKESDYKALIARIRQNNSTLETLTKQNLYLEPVRAKRGCGSPNFKLIQRCALTLYNTLTSGFQCACKTIHGLNLRLEHHDECCSSSYDGGDEKAPRFRLVFSYDHSLQHDQHSPWTLEPADINEIKSNIDNTCSVTARSPALTVKRVRFAASASSSSSLSTSSVPPKAGVLPIGNLCVAIMELRQPYRGSYLGSLAGQFNISQPALFIPATTSPTPLSLEKVLSLPRDALGRRFYRSDRLKLAVLLASSLLQLHGTPWIHERWGINDVCFLEETDDHLFDKPFISRPCTQTEDEWSFDTRWDLQYLIIRIGHHTYRTLPSSSL